MTIDEIWDKLPDYAVDMKENLKTILTTEGSQGLTEREIAAVAIASSLAASSQSLWLAVEDFASRYLSHSEIEGAKTAHAFMSMTNVYYRFLHISSNPDYKLMPPALKKKREADPGIDRRSYELSALSVSAINNCKACVDYHERNLRRIGVAAEGILSAVRIGAVINGVAEIMKYR